MIRATQLRLFAVALALALAPTLAPARLLPAAHLAAQTVAAPAAQPATPAPAGATSLTIDDAIKAALANDPGIRSGSWDLLSARARAEDAKFRMLPSLSASTGYTQLSPEPVPGAINTGITNVDETVNFLLKDFSSAPSNSRDVRLDLQYPIFAGFRLREAAEIAKLQSLGKADALELAKRALVFETKRAYWEAVRATANVDSLGTSLELENLRRGEINSLAEQGMATTADQLDEEARYDQTELSLDEARSMKAMAFLALSSLIGDQTAASASPDDYALASAPNETVEPALGAADNGGTLDEGKLIEEALGNRPDARAASVALNASLHAQTAARGDLLPSVLLSGSIAYQDPDPRVIPPVDAFDLTWSVGIRLRYDIGGVPGALERGKAAAADVEKARADLQRQRNGIALDVRRCLLAFKRARTSLDLTKGMVTQAEENLRVAQAKYDNGIAKRSELLQSQIAVLRANFAVENKLVDLEIAQADLARAAALEPLL